MNLDYQEICYITFPLNKGTAHALTKLAHIEGITQPKLLQKICETYIDEKMIEIINKTPPDMLTKILNEE